LFAGITIIAPLVLAPFGLQAQESNFQPRFTSYDRDAREGFCKLRVRVDDVTDVIMFGDRVTLRTIRGRPSYDVGSECSSPLPRRGIVDFDFRQTDGPGRANVVDSPDRADGRLMIHVVDPRDGDHKYTLEFRWRREHREHWGDWEGERDHDRPGPPPPPAFGDDRAIAMCQDVVRDRIRDEHHAHDAEFFRVRVDEGRREWVVGEAAARSRGDRLRFRFECSVDYHDGRIRSARVWERER
jgi:hypothetical protein